MTRRALSALRAGFRSLEVRNYRLYFWGQLISLTGTWMQSTAQALLVLRIADTPAAVGLVAGFQFLPSLLFVLPSGVWADRSDRYRLIFWSQTLAMLLAAVFAALVSWGHIRLWQIYWLVFLQGTVNAVSQPVRRAFVVNLVDPERRANALALNSAAFNGSRVLGPALAGLLIGPLGLAAMFWLNALSFLAVLVGLRLMDMRSLPAPRRGGRVRIWSELGEGLGYLWRHPELRRLTLLVAFIGTFGYNFTVILPLVGGYALHLQDKSAEYGGLGAMLGFGSLAGALFTLYGGRPRLGRLLWIAALFGGVLGGLALSPSYLASSLLLLGLGLSGVFFSTQANNFLQLEAPDELRGRVSSVYQLLLLGSTPLGGLFIGGASHLLGVQAALLLCAVLCWVGVTLALPKPG
ncbi:MULTISPECIES: MFS transporter [unclassified Meiothermus]|uniref:MFS transporter n=1 Tax=unclassified Meiothermus TaxID=370471 RepID=UPI001314FE59|nr:MULTISPECIES: MFS transporter [unclassified Meiothermus]